MPPFVWALLAFAATALVVILIGFAVTRESAEARTRLRQLTTGPKEERPSVEFKAPAEKRDMLPTVTRFLNARNLTERLYVELAAAGLPLRPSEFVGIVAASVLISQILGAIVARNLIVYFVFAILGASIPFFVVKVLQQKRRAMFDSQIVDALVLIASSIRSGFSFLRALQMVAQEMPPPISTEFERIISEVNVGRSMEDALRGSVQRVKSYDFDLVVTAVLIHLQIGGNLADILETIAETIRERMRIAGEIKTLTAEGRISGIALVLIPIFLAVVLTLINPSYMHTLFYEDIGRILLVVAAVFQLLGWLVIKRLLVLEY
ncbi:MAG: type II secretion system F family protein [Armatimonadota bacterium]|nr:type II secretion system F family protein [Armatimonadota bacterium]